MMRQEFPVMVMFNSPAYGIVLVKSGKLTTAGTLVQYKVDEDGRDITSDVVDLQINKSISGPDHVELVLKGEGYDGRFCGYPPAMRLV